MLEKFEEQVFELEIVFVTLEKRIDLEKIGFFIGGLRSAQYDDIISPHCDFRIFDGFCGFQPSGRAGTNCI